MPPRRFRLLLFTIPLLVGAGVLAVRVSNMTPATPRQTAPQDAALAPYGSLERALSGLDSAKIGALYGRGTKPPAKSGASRKTSAFGPSRLNLGAAAISTASDLPLVDVGKNFLAMGKISPEAAPDFAPLESARAPRTIAPRVVRAASPPVENPSDARLRAFLRGWAARQSLARADDALLQRRALDGRIAALADAAIPALDLSLVPPDVQLELTNLRLQLIPLLATSPAQRAQSQARIDAIEARLKAIWEAETARQAELQRQTLEVIPAQRAREGEAALLRLGKNQERLDQNLRAQLVNAPETGQSSPALPTLTIRQGSSLAPDAGRTIFPPNSSFAIARGKVPQPSAPLPVDDAPIARQAINTTSAKNWASVTKSQEALWRVATR